MFLIQSKMWKFKMHSIWVNFFLDDGIALRQRELSSTDESKSEEQFQ